MNHPSRRAFVRLGATGAVASPNVLRRAPPGAAAPTAQEAVDRTNVAPAETMNDVRIFEGHR